MNKLACLALIAILVSSFTPLALAQTPVVVELFTSEGCSSCPPADAELVKLSQQRTQSGAELILLGEHVDYWNYIGWTDRFSSAQFSERQSDYGKALHSSVYTPQMVVDGSVEFVGNDVSEAQRSIAAAAKHAKPAQVALRWEGDNRVHVSIQSPAPARVKVLLATTEDGLTTSVQAGENGGRTLHHAAVVRQLREIGQADKGAFEADVDIAPHPDWNAANLKLAVLAQDAATLKILGAATVAYKH